MYIDAYDKSDVSLPYTFFKYLFFLFLSTFWRQKIEQKTEKIPKPAHFPPQTPDFSGQPAWVIKKCTVEKLDVNDFWQKKRLGFS